MPFEWSNQLQQQIKPTNPIKMALIVNALINKCGYRGYVDLVTWSNINWQNPDILLVLEPRDHEKNEMEMDEMKIKVVDELYKKELIAFFEDPNVVGSKKFGITGCCGAEILTITKDLKKGIHLMYHNEDYDVDEETGRTYLYVTSEVTSLVDDAEPEDFGNFEDLIQVMAQYYSLK